jgi:hypothetical protein
MMFDVLRIDDAMWHGLSQVPRSEAQSRWLQQLFFAAIQYEILAQPAEPLAAYFPSSPRYSSQRGHRGLAEELTRFLTAHWTQIVTLVRSREIQINKLGRLAIFAPYFRHYSAGEPASFIEIGSSVGLGLLWPYLAFNFRAHGCIGSSEPHATLLTTVHGKPDVALAGRLPPPRFLAGVELNPLSAKNANDARWLRALIGPDDAFGRALLDFGLGLVTRYQPRILTGSVERVLPALLPDVPTQTLIVYHALVMQDLRDQGVAAELYEQLKRASLRHTVHEIGIEWRAPWDSEKVPPVEVYARTWSPVGPIDARIASTDDAADGRFLGFEPEPTPLTPQRPPVA